MELSWRPGCSPAGQRRGPLAVDRSIEVNPSDAEEWVKEEGTFEILEAEHGEVRASGATKVANCAVAQPGEVLASRSPQCIDDHHPPALHRIVPSRSDQIPAKTPDATRRVR